MKNKKDKFHWRGFTSFFITFLGIVSLVSGVILYIVPPGRVAYWIKWKLWGLTKEQWEAVHTITSFLLFFFIVLHLYYNWRIFLGYIRAKFKKGLRLKKELALSLVLTLFVTAGSIADIQPFSAIMNFSEKIKESWDKKTTPPPIPYAERLTIEELSKEIGEEKEKIYKILKNKKINFNKKDTLKVISEKNGLSPDKIYSIIKEGLKENSANIKKGYGKMKISELCTSLNINIERCLEILKTKGMDVLPDENVRECAIRYNINPFEFAQILKEANNEGNKEETN